MSFFKYLSDQSQRNVARTADGYPIRGNMVPFLKQSEYEEITLGSDAYVKVFETDNADHMTEYQAVLDKIANQLFYRLADDVVQWVPDRNCWFILVRWAEIKGEFSPAFMSKVGGYTR